MAFKIDFMESYDLESIAAELRRIAKVTGKQTVSSRDINRFGRIHSRTVIVKFGTLRKAVEAANLEPSPVTRWTSNELLKVVADLWTMTLKDTGRSPIMSDLRKYGFQLSPCTISNRFGTWRKALLEANKISDSGTLSQPEETARGRTAISVRKRFLVFKRDLYQCQICRRSGVELEVDHIIPISRGGSDTVDNLQALCVPCNRGKSGSLQ